MDTIAIGIAIGCVYALVAVGYSLIYRTTGIVNFAQGAFVMIGGMVAYWFFGVLHSAYVVAILGGVAAAGVAGLVLWYGVVWPLWRWGRRAFVVILATLVYGDLCQNVVALWLGTNPETLPAWFRGFRLTLGGAGISGQYVVVIGLSLVLIAGLSAFLRWSGLGRALRACAADRRTSQLLGIAPERIGAIAMALTAGVGGLGGVVFTAAQYTAFTDAFAYGVFGFVAAVLGGFGSLTGSIVGGLALGLIEALTGRYVSTTYEEVIAFAVLLVLIAWRPQGLLGTHWEGQG